MTTSRLNPRCGCGCSSSLFHSARKENSGCTAPFYSSRPGEPLNCTGRRTRRLVAMDWVELSVVTPDPLDPGHLDTAVAAAGAAATVVFQGVGRDHDPQATGTVTGLEYSAHPDATRFLRDVVAEANISVHNPQDTEPLPVRVAAAHRIGPLNVGETALVVA